ncbi:AAA family ATPase [Endozoicomonas sp. ALD040]|uniref:AAA family ATPase n=1 Tax=unclassified Endozoicomonas TaxID=2644528 RepID=UPI003BB12364
MSVPPEVGREVIKKQVESQGLALPWCNKVAFRDEMVREEIINYERYRMIKDTVFFDRCVIDCYGYSTLEQLPVSNMLLRYCIEISYRKSVFLFPPWESIFTNDLERKQDFNEAVATYEHMVEAYYKFGYDLVEVPKCSTKKRAEFIVNNV